MKKLNKRKSRIQRVRETIGVGSDVTNVDWRDVEVSGTGVAGDASPYGYIIVQSGMDRAKEKRLTLGDLVTDRKIKIKFKKGDSYEERDITNPADLLKEIIQKSFTPEAAQNWSKEINHVKHLKPEIREKIKEDPDYKIDPEKDYMGTIIQPKTYGDYAMSLLGAMSSMREGRAQFDKHSTGAKVKPYFEADTGANLFGMLASRIQLLQQNISQETPTNLEEGSPRNTYKKFKSIWLLLMSRSCIQKTLRKIQTARYLLQSQPKIEYY